MLNSIFLGVLGFMVWTFASMSLAAAECNEAAESAAERTAPAKPVMPSHKDTRCEFCTY